MLSLAKELVTDPALLLVDEPSAGLAPRIVEQVYLGTEAEVIARNEASLASSEYRLLGVVPPERATENNPLACTAIGWYFVLSRYVVTSTFAAAVGGWLVKSLE